MSDFNKSSSICLKQDFFSGDPVKGKGTRLAPFAPVTGLERKNLAGGSELMADRIQGQNLRGFT